LVGVPARLLASRCHRVHTSEHELSHGFYTFNSDINEESLSEEERRALSPQNKPLLLGEIGLFWSTIPPQKAPLNKECQNVLTPPKVTSGPP